MAGENKETPVLTNEAIEAKVAKGEALSENEREFIKGNPNTEAGEKKSTEEEDADDVEVGEEKEEEAPAADEEKPPASKETPAPAKNKPGEKSKETPAQKQTPEERKALIESELAKPQGQQDLSKFTESEIGVFVDLKKQRAKNQRLQEENDALKFENLKGKLKAKPDTEEVEEDPLDGIGEDDVITGKQLKEILTKSQAAGKKKSGNQPLITPETVAANEITAEAGLKAKGITDYQDVAQYVQFALYDDPDAPGLLIEAAKKGENVAETAYWLVKGSKKWPTIKKLIAAEKGNIEKPPAKKEEKPPADNADRAERFKKNNEKIKTTGAGGGSGDEVGEYTAQDVASMSVEEFRALPRDTRDSILKKFGSEPNMSK